MNTMMISNGSERRPRAGSAREDTMPTSVSAPSATPHICALCSKSFVVVSGPGVGNHRGLCLCGGDLVPATLTPGVYEVRKPRKTAARGRARAAERKPESHVPREADQGYNESHGYGPSHGGPSGPGDAPAPATPPPPSSPPADEASE